MTFITMAAGALIRSTMNCFAGGGSPYLDSAGMAATDRAVLATLILSTESASGVPLARCCHGWHNGAVTPPPSPPRPELACSPTAPAGADGRRADRSRRPALRGADARHAALTTARLEAEWHIVLGAAGKVEFIDRHVGALQVAQFFQPNLLAVRQASLA